MRRLTDEEDGSYTLFPLFGVEYRLTVIECLTQLIQVTVNSKYQLY